MDILTISFPMRTVARNLPGTLRRVTIYLNSDALRIFFRLSLILLREKNAVSEEEKKPEKSTRTTMAKILTVGLISPEDKKMWSLGHV